MKGCEGRFFLVRASLFLSYQDRHQNIGDKKECKLTGAYILAPPSSARDPELKWATMLPMWECWNARIFCEFASQHLILPPAVAQVYDDAATHSLM